MAIIVDNFSGQPHEGKGQIVRLDYVARTDDQPVYVGFAEAESATSEAVWKIMRMTYDGSDRLTLREWAVDEHHKVTFSQVWNDRATLTYG